MLINHMGLLVQTSGEIVWTERGLELAFLDGLQLTVDDAIHAGLARVCTEYTKGRGEYA